MTPDNVSEFFAARRFKASIGNGTDVSYAVTHNLGTTDVIVQLLTQVQVILFTLMLFVLTPTR